MPLLSPSRPCGRRRAKAEPVAVTVAICVKPEGHVTAAVFSLYRKNSSTSPAAKPDGRARPALAAEPATWALMLKATATG